MRPYRARQGIAERVGELTSSLRGRRYTDAVAAGVAPMDLLKTGLVSDKLDASAARPRAVGVEAAALAFPGWHA